MKKLIYMAAAGAMLASCSPKSGQTTTTTTTTTPTTTATTAPQPQPLPGDAPLAMIPKATAFRMSGDYSRNVAVTLGPDGNLLYYPAPTDLTAGSAPVEIGDGWWLNRQGLGPGSVFTRRTFDEYRALKKAPTPEQIKAAIIPGASVTDFRRLPVDASKAAGMPASELMKYLE